MQNEELVAPEAQFKPEDKALPFEKPETVDASVLATFKYEYAETPSGAAMEITTVTDEFTSVCPFSGLPDFAEVTIRYIPDKLCLELRAMKYYLMAYRNVGIWYEHLVNRILLDLVGAVHPKMMRVTIVCKSRGGLSTTTEAEYLKE